MIDKWGPKVCTVAGCIILPLGNTTGMKECTWFGGQCLGGCHMSNWHPHECPGLGISSRTLHRSSYYIYWLVLVPQYFLEQSFPPHKRCTSHPPVAKENGTHQTSQPSSIAPRFSLMQVQCSVLCRHIWLWIKGGHAHRSAATQTQMQQSLLQCIVSHSSCTHH